LKASFVFFFKKINSGYTIMPLKGGRYACVEGLLRLFHLLKQFKYHAKPRRLGLAWLPDLDAPLWLGGLSPRAIK
jgi:hypothetical protein